MRIEESDRGSPNSNLNTSQSSRTKFHHFVRERARFLIVSAVLKVPWRLMRHLFLLSQRPDVCASEKVLKHEAYTPLRQLVEFRSFIISGSKRVFVETVVRIRATPLKVRRSASLFAVINRRTSPAFRLRRFVAGLEKY